MLLAANGQLGPAIVETLWTFSLSLALAALLGFAAGLAIGSVPVLRRWSALLLEFFRALPPPVIVPVAVLLLGYAASMKISVIVLASVWPILLNVVSAVTRVEGGLVDVGRSLRLTRAEILTKLLIPAVVPGVLTGIRVATPLAIVIALLIEMLTAMPGLGGLLVAAQRNFNPAQVFGMLAVVGMLGLMVNLLVNAVEGVIMRRWPPRGVAQT
jgi:ABC-type nitrate/sulfonate/bicarbonate transport system permease component